MDPNPSNAEQHSSDKPLLPTINLPKGGGAIQSIGEKFSVNLSNGTASATIPIAVSSGRNGFSPQLQLTYDSGAGNSPFGLGWNLGLPSISRKTAKGLPQYADHADSDTFQLTGAEDLVPFLHQPDGTNWERKVTPIDGYEVHAYRPRTEGLFSKIEKWVDPEGDVFWKTTSRENVTSFYGRSDESRIHAGNNIFEWLLEESRDNRGNLIRYHYISENADNIDASLASEYHRIAKGNAFNQKYIKTISYGNKLPDDNSQWHFRVVFDYGDHHDETPTPTDYTTGASQWEVRPDPFSTFRPGFEVRTYRRCKRIMLFHEFDELGDLPVLVKSTDLDYDDSPAASTLTSAIQSGYMKEGAAYLKKSFPPVAFDYVAQQVGSTVHDLPRASFNNLPYGVDGDHYQWVDLHGEGIAGVLSHQNGGWFYKENLGNGNLGEKQALPSQPSLAGRSRPVLQDLDGDGQLEFVLNQAPASGYYEISDGEWQYFQPFEAVPNINWQSPDLKLIDLNGDGFADVMITETDRLLWFPSKGIEGYDKGISIQKALDEQDGPALVFADPTQSVFLADFSGDGLTDIVRIRNKDICYWPNMGYGKFGQKITMDNAPEFDQPEVFNPDYLHLADVDGTGPVDLLYITEQEVRYWNNLSGNSWSDENRIEVAIQTDNLKWVQVTDLLGTGTPCLVWSSSLPEDQNNPMKYLELMPGQKPWLLRSINNNMGKEQVFRYATSTKFYLEDKANGTPWITKLSFPVYVVEQVETIDHISNSRLVANYKYHHGYFDPYEREFRGFGMVEQWDAESFEDFKKNNDGELLDHYVPPVYTKTWMHTGAYVKKDSFSQHFASEYYQGDTLAPPMPDSTIASDEPLNFEATREAYRALRGQALRVEVYSQDGTDLSEHPYTVTENNYHLQQLQPHHENAYAVYLSTLEESLSYHYERNCCDPRVMHTITLETDIYGTVLQSAEIVYPRRDGAPHIYPVQQHLHVVLTENDVVHSLPQSDYYLLATPTGQQTFEVSNIVPGGMYFIADELRSKLHGIEVIPYDATPSSSKPQKRLLTWGRSFYWNDEQDAALNSGEIAWPLLPHHAETASFTQALLDELFTSGLTSEMITNDGKYIEKDGYWWNPGTIQDFEGPDKFHIPARTVDPFGNEAFVRFDPYHLIPVESEDDLNNITTATIDYRTLTPWRVVDFNGNFSENLTDALGMVTVTSMYGVEADENNLVVQKGDAPVTSHPNKTPDSLDELLKTPETFLENATSFSWIDLHSWSDPAKSEPVSVVMLRRETHISEPGGDHSDIHIAISYSDGFGRELQKKISAEPGEAFWRDDSDELILDAATNEPVKGHTAKRWLTSARTVYNNKQQPIKRFEPFFSSTAHYESDDELAYYGISPLLHYDALDRVIRTDSPKGYFSKEVTTPWQVSTYDHNDTVLDSPYLRSLLNDDAFLQSHDELKTALAIMIGATPEGPEKEELIALQKATLHFETPTHVILDSLGRPAIEQVYQQQDQPLSTHTIYNITGQPVAITDHRQTLLNQSRALVDQVTNFTYRYDMAGNNLYQKGIDSGEIFLFFNAHDLPLYSRNSLGDETFSYYDSLLRPTEVWVKEKGVFDPILVERYVYGESLTDLAESQKRNLRGNEIEHYDGIGRVKHLKYSFRNEMLETSTQFCNLFEQTPDWNKLTANDLEKDEFKFTYTYDALGRIIRSQTPDGSVTLPSFNHSGQLTKMELDLHGHGSFSPYIKNASYNEKGQRQHIQYGNDVVTNYAYDALTYQLNAIHTTRNSGADHLQWLRYAFDPSGNITSVKDQAEQTLFYKGQVVHPHQSFTYDALYQLTEATGREHIGQNAPFSQFDSHRTGKLHKGDGHAMRRYGQSYTYDTAGNLLHLHHQAGTQSWNRYFEYFHSNNRLEKHGFGDPVNWKNHQYNAAGNLLNLDTTDTLSWNHNNELSYLERGTTKAWYNYDSDGKRGRKVVQEQGEITKVSYYLSGFEVYREYKKEELQIERQSLGVSNDNKQIALIETKVVDNASPSKEILVRYQLANHLGSSSLEVDESGLVISKEEYYPFGCSSYQAVSKDKEVPSKRYRYSGMERDEESGLNYHQARYFAPWLCRWIKPDPEGTVDGLNLYRYSRNSPINLVDPNGTEATPAEKQAILDSIPPHIRKLDTIDIAIKLKKLQDKYYKMRDGKLEQYLQTQSFIDTSNDIIKEQTARIKTIKSSGRYLRNQKLEKEINGLIDEQQAAADKRIAVEEKRTGKKYKVPKKLEQFIDRPDVAKSQWKKLKPATQKEILHHMRIQFGDEFTKLFTGLLNHKETHHGTNIITPERIKWLKKFKAKHLGGTILGGMQMWALPNGSIITLMFDKGEEDRKSIEEAEKQIKTYRDSLPELQAKEAKLEAEIPDKIEEYEKLLEEMDWLRIADSLVWDTDVDY